MTAVLDRTTTAPKRVLMVVANPATSTTTGWPVRFWASELFRPLYVLRGRLRRHAVRRLIPRRRPHSGRKVAALVIEVLGV
ncbi:MAG TPA: hypothetical protein VFY32_14570 [Solirubrobacteraceae bacterium]|nr:hypothetical protein [Solirubrobacteraceae bacterium]